MEKGIQNIIATIMTIHKEMYHNEVLSFCYDDVEPFYIGSFRSSAIDADGKRIILNDLCGGLVGYVFIDDLSKEKVCELISTMEVALHSEIKEFSSENA